MTDKVEAVKAEEPAKNPLEKSVDITVSAAELKAGTQAELKRYAKKAKMAGFRPGHVPFAMVESMYGQQAYMDTLNKLIDAGYRKAVEENKFNVVGQADCQPKETKEGEDLQFTLTFECYPEIANPDFAALELKRYTCPVTDAEVAKTLDIMVKQRVTYEEEAGRAAAAEDRVTINFKGTKDGEAFQGGSADGFAFVLAQGRMLPEFETAVTGMTAGEKKSFDLTFPKDYGNAELADKQVVFEVECVKVEKPIYPTIDEEFAKSLGLESVEAMNNEVRRNLEREVKARLLQRTKNEVFNAILAAADFQAPKAMVAQEQQRLADEMSAQMMRYTGKKDNKPMPLELFAEPAVRQTRLGMLAAAILEHNKLTVEEADLNAHIEEMASAYEQPEEMIKWIKQDKQQLSNISAVVLENKMIEFILGKAKTAEEVVAFDELMGNQAQ